MRLNREYNDRQDCGLDDIRRRHDPVPVVSLRGHVTIDLHRHAQHLLDPYRHLEHNDPGLVSSMARQGVDSLY